MKSVPLTRMRACWQQLQVLLTGSALLSQAFRPFFLASASYALLAMILWLLTLSGELQWRAALNPVVWHAHEMLFGFGAAVLSGFLLTAAKHWTGLNPISSTQLLVSVSLWLAARALLALSLLASELNSALFVAASGVVESCWWILSITLLARVITQAKNYHNYLLLPLLLVLMMLDNAILWLDLSAQDSQALQLTQASLLVFVVIIGIVGGRVIPFFAARALGNFAATPMPVMNRLILIISLCGLASYSLGIFYSLAIPGYGFFYALAVLHFYRLYHWLDRRLFAQPMLWSLVLAYFFTALGLALIGASLQSPRISLGNALHLITIGALGLMMLSMMARVSLGHTNRHIVATHSLVFAFVCLLLAAVTRAFGALLFPELIFLFWLVSGILWSTAFLIFIKNFYPILISPRLV